MTDFFIPLFWLCGFLGTLALVQVWGSWRRSAVVDVLRNDPQVRGRLGASRRALAGGELQVETVPPLRPASLSRPDPKEDWEIGATCASVAQRTVLSLERRGMRALLHRPADMVDVDTGDTAFDVAFQLRASAADAARGMFANATVKEAARTLFQDPELYRLTIDGSGHVVCRSAPFLMDAAHMRTKLLLVVALLDALDNAADAPALPEPVAGSLEGVGAASGSPVGVPLQDHRRR